MNFKLILTIFYISIFFTNLGQFSRTKNWVVGDGVLIDFNENPPLVSTSSLQSFEGYSVISDVQGNLLFYTNGITVWNAQHQQMPNGYGLNSALSATNAALIVPKPGNSDIYFIFTVGAYGGNQGGFGGTAYSIVDMTLNGGLGDITQKNIILHTKSTEKLCATKHENGTDVWIMTHDFGNDQFRAFLLTQNGIISPPVISKIGAVHVEYPIGDWGSQATGSMRFSPSGCRLALVLAAGQTDTVQVFNFDNSSGYLFNPLSIRASVYSGYNPYLLCFSPDNTKLYISGFDWILQFNINGNQQFQMQLSKKIIATNTVAGGFISEFEDLQIAPNGKIYVSRMWDSYLSCIESPNNPGILCNFMDTAISIPGFQCEYGLPNFVSNYLIPDSVAFESCAKYCPDLDLGNDTIICEGNFFKIKVDLPQGSINWNDGSSSFDKVIIQPGNYIANYNFNGCPVKIDTIHIGMVSNPLFDLVEYTTCIVNDISISLPYIDSASYLWSNGFSGNEFVTNQAGSYILAFEKNNCVFFDTLTIIDDCSANIQMPNIFTPNDDKNNDLFSPIIFKNVASFDMTVLNRWGSVVFYGEGTQIHWDGKHKGFDCSEGVYFYLINYVDFSGKQFKINGYVTLVK